MLGVGFGVDNNFPGFFPPGIKKGESIKTKMDEIKMPSAQWNVNCLGKSTIKIGKI